MALRMYWCVLKRRGTTFFGNATFKQVTRFTCELDPAMSHTLRAAFLNEVKQQDGADAGEYRMDVYDDPRYSRAVVEDFTVPPDSAEHREDDSLAGYTDDQLLSELAWRLRRR
jgi:hypothetical protein